MLAHSLGSVGGRVQSGTLVAPGHTVQPDSTEMGTRSLIPSLKVTPSHRSPRGLWEKAPAMGVPTGRESPALSVWPLQDMTSSLTGQLGPRPTDCAGNALPFAQIHRKGAQTGPRGAGPTASASTSAILGGLGGGQALWDQWC